MAVRYYNTSLGVFPVIVSTEALNTVVSWGDSSPAVYNRGTLTERGQAFINSGIFNGLVVPVLNNEGVTIYATNYNLFSNLGLVLNVIDIAGAGNTEQYFYDYDDNHQNYIQIGYKRPTNLNSLTVYNTFISGSDTFTALDHHAPFGGTLNFSSNICLGVAILVANDDMTAFGYAQLETSNYANTIFLKGKAITNTSQLTAVKNYFGNKSPVVEHPDPYGWNEPTGPSEPISDHILVHDDIDFPALPTATLSDAGFVSLWTPTKEQLQTLARYMWNIDITSIDFWKKLVASPLELIFGLSIIPYDVHDDDSPYHVYQDSLTMGYVNTHIDMDYIEEQFIEVDFGSVDLTEYIGAYLDYDPYTKFSIYLPYIGVKDLSADDIMNRTISLKYRIDLASGACVAMIKCTGTDPTIGEVDSIFYSFSGSCSTQVPISASQQQELVRSIVSIGVGVAATAATIFTGGLTAVGAATAVGATANGALGLKSHYAHSGNMGSTAGFMGVQNPYLIVSRPRLAIPGEQNVYMGYPSFITMTLGDLSGYTEVEVTHLDRLDCTEEEMSEIAELLKKGVFF